MAEDVVFKVEVDDSDVKKQLDNSVDAIEEVGQTAEKANKTISESSDKAVSATRKIGSEYEKSRGNASQFGNEVEKTGRSVRTYSEEADDAARNTKDFGNAAEDAKSSADKLGKSVDNLKANVSDAGKTIASIGGSVAAAMATVGVMAVKSGGSLQQNLGGSEAVFSSYADTIQEEAKRAYETMGMAESQYLATANQMGALFKGVGFETAESVELTTSAMLRAADVASVMGKSGADAMEAIAGAAKGNFTMLDNLGVAINDTTLAIYAQEKGLGELETTQAKVNAAMQMFMERTAYAAGNYAKENETFAGSLQSLQARIQNVIADVGMKLLPQVTEFVNYIDDNADEIADTIGDIGDAIGGAIDFLGDMTKFLWENKEAVASAAVAFVAFKTSMAIGNVVSAAVSAVKSYKTAVDLAKTSQLALNAAGNANPFVLIASVVVGAIAGIVAFSASAEDCSEKLSEMNATAEEMMNTSESYMEQSQKLSDVADKYTAIHDSEKSAYEKGVELKNIQDLLIEQYGSQAEGIDLVNGEYSEQLGLLNELIGKNKELSLESAKASYLTAKEAQENEFTFNVSAKNADIRNTVQDMLEAEAQKQGVTTSRGILWNSDQFTWGAGTSYEQRDSILSEVIRNINETYGDNIDAEVYNSLVTARDENKKAWDTLLDVEKRYNELFDPLSQYKSTGTAVTHSTAEHEAEKGRNNTYSAASTQPVSKTGNTDEYKSLKSTLDYRHDMEEISDSEYIEQLGSLRDTYLVTDSDEWRSANLTIKRLKDSAKKTALSTSKLPSVTSPTAKKEVTEERLTTSEKVDTVGNKSVTGNKSGTVISIDSYIPTVWDDADTANEKLKKGLGLALSGNSRSGKIIEGLEEMVPATTLSSKNEAVEKAESTLTDVVSAIKALQKSDEERHISLVVDLYARDLMIGTVAVADINDITIKNGESPLI